MRESPPEITVIEEREALHGTAELVGEGMERVGKCEPKGLPVFVWAAKQPKHLSLKRVQCHLKRRGYVISFPTCENCPCIQER